MLDGAAGLGLLDGGVDGGATTGGNDDGMTVVVGVRDTRTGGRAVGVTVGMEDGASVVGAGETVGFTVAEVGAASEGCIEGMGVGAADGGPLGARLGLA